MAEQELFADSNGWVCRLEICNHFEALTATEKLYAHWISRYVEEYLFQDICCQKCLIVTGCLGRPFLELV